MDGHNATVHAVSWNPQHEKLTTADKNGLIVVWVLHKGMWFEEMVNNRDGSTVADLKWRADGEHICIAYEDGNVLVGTVDGNRMWAKDLPHKISQLAWAPDGRVILFAAPDGVIRTYNSVGNQVGTVAVRGASAGQPLLVRSMDWYDGLEGHDDPDQFTLAIALSNGTVQLMRHDRDPSPVVLDTGLLELQSCAWNPAGTVLAVTGKLDDSSCAARFFSSFGQDLRQLRVPGTSMRSVSWEGGSNRFVLAVDSSLYFATARQTHRWAAFGDTVAYAYNRPGKHEQVVVFWDTTTHERHFKNVNRLRGIAAAPNGQACVLAVAAEEQADLPYVLVLCNALGSPVDTVACPFPPITLSATETHAIACSAEYIFTWQYSAGAAAGPNTSSLSGQAMSALRRKEGRTRCFHVDDPRAGEGTDTTAALTAARSTSLLPSEVADPIVAAASCSIGYVVARRSGVIQRYSLPHGAHEVRYVLPVQIRDVAMNCDGTRLAVVDAASKLTFFDCTAGGGSSASSMAAPPGAVMGPGDRDHKDVWDMRWADDNPTLFVCMQKAKMYIVRDGTSEAPVPSSGYLGRFHDLCAQCVLLDEIMADPRTPGKDAVELHDAKVLRDTRAMLGAGGDLAAAYAFVAERPHSRLWRLVAEAALEAGDYALSERAFVATEDYQGIQFVKRLRGLPDKDKQRAEVAVWFGRWDDAERAYVAMHRVDLAAEMHMRLGNWFRVIQLAQAEGMASDSDELLTTARVSLGDHYADRQQWRKAVQYYKAAGAAEPLVHCLYMAEDYAGLEELISDVPEGTPLLANIGFKLQSVGAVKGAVAAFLRAGDTKAAVDACVLLNDWEAAVKLAAEHDFPQIVGLLDKYAERLLSDRAVFQAVELYRRAARPEEAAKLLARLAAMAGLDATKPRRAKQLYVLAAFEVKAHRQAAIKMSEMSAATLTRKAGTTAAAGTTRAAGATAATLNTLLAQDTAATAKGMSVQDVAAARVLDSAWRGAEAWHFWMLAHRQLYKGALDAALITAARLMEYESVIHPRRIWSLLALTAYSAGFFGLCSRAFMKLEVMGTGDALDPLAAAMQAAGGAAAWAMSAVPGSTAAAAAAAATAASEGKSDDSASASAQAGAGPAVEVVTQADRDRYADTALAIFMARPPVDSATVAQACPKCDGRVPPWATGCMSCGARYDACVASGRPVLSREYSRCGRCNHKILNDSKPANGICPLCHAELAKAK